MKKSTAKDGSDSEEDPLDVFMAGIDAEVKRNNYAAQQEDTRKEDKSKGFRADIDGEDDEESYYRYELSNKLKTWTRSEREKERERGGNNLIM